MNTQNVKFGDGSGDDDDDDLFQKFSTENVDEEEEDDDEEDEDYKPGDENDDAGSVIDEEDDDDHVETVDDIQDVSSSINEKRTRGATVAVESSASSANDDNNLVQIDKDKIDMLWSDFFADPKKPDTNVKEEEKLAIEKKVIVTKEYDFAGETVRVQEEVKLPISQFASSSKNANSADDIFGKAAKTDSDLDNSVKKEEDEEEQKSKEPQPPPTTIKRRGGGLGDLLNQFNKKPKMSTLTKSMHDWNDFKRTQNIEEELDQHRRSKNSFVERQAFLQRTDLREFEREKSVRDHDRKIRDLAKNKPN